MDTFCLVLVWYLPGQEEPIPRSDGEDWISPRNPNFMLYGKTEGILGCLFWGRRRIVLIERREFVGFGGGGKYRGADWGPLSPRILSFLLILAIEFLNLQLGTYIPSHLQATRYFPRLSCQCQTIWLSSGWWGMKESEECHFQVISLWMLTLYSSFSVA